MVRVRTLQQNCFLRSSPVITNKRNTAHYFHLCFTCLFLLLTASLSQAVVTLSLPNGVSYTFDNKGSELKKRSYKYISASETSETSESQDAIHLTLDKQQGLIRYSYGQTSHSKTARGDLYITLVVPAGEEMPVKTLGVQYLKSDSEFDDDIPETLSLVEGVAFSEIQPGSLGCNVPATEPRMLKPAGSAQSTLPSFEISTKAKSHVLWSKVNDICFDELEFHSPVLQLDSGSFPFQTQNVTPQESATLVFHFVPSDGSSASIVVHSCTGATATATGNRLLGVDDLNMLSMLDTLDTFVSIVRLGGVPNHEIEAIKSGPNTDYEKSYKLLLAIHQQKGDEFTSEYFAELCERVGKGTLASRVRTGKLEVTLEDQDLQAEMSTIGQYIDAEYCGKTGHEYGVYTA